MSIDFNGILTDFVRVARDGVGSQLATIGPTGTEFPAVIKVRQNGPKPEYPYVTIDVLDVDDGGEWLLADYVEANGDLVYETNKNLLINYRVYGGNALDIANNLHGYLRADSVLSSIRTNTGGAVVTLDAIDSLPVLLSDSYLESASFNLVFGITDTLTITDTGENYIESIDADGVLHNGATDPPPLDVDVVAP